MDHSNNAMLANINCKLNCLATLWIVVIGIVMLFVVGVIDYVTGFEISMSLFILALSHL